MIDLHLSPESRERERAGGKRDKQWNASKVMF